MKNLFKKNNLSKSLIIFLLLTVCNFSLVNAQESPINNPTNAPDTGKALYYQFCHPRKIRILNFNRNDSNVIGTRWFKNSTHSYLNATEIKSTDIDSLIPATDNLGATHYFVLIQYKGNFVSTSNIKTIEIVENPQKPTIAQQPSTEDKSYCKNDKTTFIQVQLQNLNNYKPIYDWYITNNNDENNKVGILIENAHSNKLAPSTNLTGKHYYYSIIRFENSNYTLTSNYSGGITIYNNPIVKIVTAENIINKTLYVNQNALTIVSASGAQSYNWIPTNAVNNAIATNTYLANQTTTLYLIGKDENGCSASDTLNVYVNKNSLDIAVNNIMSPNNDGLNDYFVVKLANNFDNKPIKLEIKNTDGVLVYKSDNYHNNWFGLDFNNNKLSGAFEYTITIDNTVYKGALSIIY